MYLLTKYLSFEDIGFNTENINRFLSIKLNKRVILNSRIEKLTARQYSIHLELVKQNNNIWHRTFPLIGYFSMAVFLRENNSAVVGYMQTARPYRKKGVQQFMQALIYSAFNIEEVLFDNTKNKGRKYIKNSSLFLIKSTRGKDILGAVNPLEVQRILNKIPE